jgi:hypothetical protein
MDPSEFEGTVERAPDAANAGVLENLLTSADLPKFQSLDLLKESQDIYLAIYNLQSLIVKDDKPSSENEEMISLSEIEDFSSKLIELKEDYFNRRNKLKQVVKTFLSSLPDESELTSSEIPKEEFLLMSKKSVETVDFFKTEYDHLSGINKQIENIFLKSFKYIQQKESAIDNSMIIKESLQICLKCQDLLKNAQEQLNVAEKIVYSCSSSSSSLSGSSNSNEPDVSLPSLTAVINALMNDKRSSSLSSSLPSNPSNHSLLLSNHPSSSTLEITLNPSNSSSNTSTNSNYNNATIATATAKWEKEREELQEYYHCQLTSLKNKYEIDLKNSTNIQLLSFQEKETLLTRKLETIINQKDSEINELLTMIQSSQMKEQLLNEKEKMILIENEKRSNLEEKVRNNVLEIANLENRITLMNQEKQSMILQLKEQNYEFSQFQRKNEEKQREIQKKSQEQSSQIMNYQQLLSLLPTEEDIHRLANSIGYHHQTEEEFTKVKQSAVLEEEKSSKQEKEETETETGRCLLTWSILESFIIERFRKLNNEMISSRIKENDLQMKYQQLETLYQTTLEKLETQEKLFGKDDQLPSSSAVVVSSSSSIPDDFLSDLIQPSLSQQASLSSKNLPLTANENNEQENKVLSVIQEQRNYYRKLYEKNEKDLQLHRSSVSKLEEEKEQLTQENMELYRRLRILRVINNTGSSSLTTISASSDVRSRGKNFSMDVEGGNGADSIDQKYHQLYENAELNPYKIIELEKKQYLSSLNVFERIIAFFYHYIMKDTYLRNLFLIYFIFIHFLSFLYVFQILNPQLIEEVDEKMKYKWATETFDKMDLHPDLME